MSKNVLTMNSKLICNALKHSKKVAGLKTPNRLYSSCEDIPTHTGQKWNQDDYRLSRFMIAPKQVNQNWAVYMIAQIPPTIVSDRVVWCDGGSGPEGHPKVFINLDKPGCHSCGYCGLRFMKKDDHH